MGPGASMYRVELAKAAHRWRTWLLAAALGAIPVVMTIALKLSPPPEPLDASDALAIAICHLHTASTLSHYQALGRG